MKAYTNSHTLKTFHLLLMYYDVIITQNMQIVSVNNTCLKFKKQIQPTIFSKLVQINFYFISCCLIVTS